MPDPMRHLYLALGLVFVALGLAGVVLPVVPTTPFLIVAAGCFARSSPRLERWLLAHPRFGPVLQAWRERRAIPRKAKLLALVGGSFGLGMLWLGSGAGPLVMLPPALLFLAGLAFVFSRPSL
jgi:uncharacterized membrane protein YbaN (DUF454 family)